MKYKFGILTAIGASLMVAAPAYAADQTGQELIGRIVDVQFANGVSNSVTFGAGGQARIASADGTLSNASWFVNDNQICLQSGTVGECWGYTERFVAGRSFTMSSTCNMTSQWKARSVNAAPVAAPAAQQGERG